MIKIQTFALVLCVCMMAGFVVYAVDILYPEVFGTAG